jgi:hypothetical protein
MTEKPSKAEQAITHFHEAIKDRKEADQSCAEADKDYENYKEAENQAIAKLGPDETRTLHRYGPAAACSNIGIEKNPRLNEFCPSLLTAHMVEKDSADAAVIQGGEANKELVAALILGAESEREMAWAALRKGEYKEVKCQIDRDKHLSTAADHLRQDFDECSRTEFDNAKQTFLENDPSAPCVPNKKPVAPQKKSEGR